MPDKTPVEIKMEKFEKFFQKWRLRIADWYKKNPEAENLPFGWSDHADDYVWFPKKEDK